MLSVKLDEIKGIAIFEPVGPLSKNDFEKAAAVIDPYIKRTGRLNGLIIHTKSFPGWKSFAALFSHLKFVREHQDKIGRVALVTDSVVGNMMEKLASRLIKAEIKLFPYNGLESVKSWVSGDGADNSA